MAIRNLTLADIGVSLSKAAIYVGMIGVGTSLAIRGYVSQVKYHDAIPKVACRTDINSDYNPDLVVEMSDNSKQKMLNRNGEYVNANDALAKELAELDSTQKEKRQKVINDFNDLRAKLREADK